ncbi:MAG: TlpA disulfide reductase family protein [Endozoicomonas sp. (ex Botrylloides leachii)]|nr:TlpA disulfide reductase family protein [Endozoicomonas sp. (ex Botrylloides leachii)]
MSRVTLLTRSVMFIVVLLGGCQKPDFTAVNGGHINLKDSQGRWLILNIWADWCPACRKKIPELNHLREKGDIRVIGYDFDGSQGQLLLKKIKDLNIKFPVIEENPLPTINAKNPTSLPATYIINADGKLLDTLYGPQTEKDLSLRLRKLQTSIAPDS